jgi:hypothetical protein
MSTKSILTMLIITAVAVIFGFKDAKAGFPAPPGLPGPPNVNVHIDGYLPAPPGVSIQIDAGRPYYVERGRRVYIKEERHARHHKVRGHKYGHYRQKRHYY